MSQAPHHPPVDQAPVDRTNQVLLNFFGGVQWATTLFEVKMLAAQALEEIQALMS